MERAFQAALTLLAPEAVFVLGDVTDEGKWANDEVRILFYTEQNKCQIINL